jgi:GNAT superfamily N-acetyltransferase
MPREAEISFEEAMGAVTPSPALAASTTVEGEISFTEATGPQEVRRPFTQRLGEHVSQSLARQREGSDLLSRGRVAAAHEGIYQLFGDIEADPQQGFLKNAGNTALRGIRAVVSDPLKATTGGLKAMAGGAISMAEQVPAGFRGLGEAAGTALMRETVGRIPLGQASAPGAQFIGKAAAMDPVARGAAGVQDSLEATAAMREVASQITKVNLSPSGETEKAMEDLLMLLPEGIAAAGDTVYDKTGSALAGAGTQGLLTLLTITPQTAGKVVSRSMESVKSKQLFNTTFDALAKTEQEAAKQVIDHIAQGDKKAAAKLRVRYDEAQKKWISAEKLGEKTVEAVLKGKEITPDEAGVGLSDAAAELPQAPPAKPAAKRAVEFIADEETGAHIVRSESGEILTQENRGYLQIKRSDVLEAERGKGHAQEMMKVLLEQAEARDLVLGSDFSVSKDAQRVYEALKKKGFEVKENPNTVNPETGSKVTLDPRVPVYEVTRKATEPKRNIADEPTVDLPLAEAAKTEQIFVSGPTLDSLPGGKFVKGKMAAWWDEIIRTINPEALGPKAKQSAAILASKIAETMNRDAANHGLAADRIAFWDKVPEAMREEFVSSFEKGKAQATAEMQKLADYIRKRNQEIYVQDQANGIKYDPTDNYLYHLFEEGEKLAAVMEAKYGAKWGDPKFTKDRIFELYDEARKAGYRPKFTNPEEIMLMRQHASDIAQMQVELLKDLETYGLAHEKTKANPDPPKTGQYNYRRAPSGKGYWVEATADQILHNAFDTKSLWNMPGIRGDVFKGAMFLKNSTVPIVLSLSLFHPLHLLLGMDSAAAMTRLTKQMIVSGMSPVKWFGKWLEQMTLGSKGIPLYGIIDNPRVGFKLLKAYQGKIDPAKLTAADRTALQYMSEGGFIPEMSMQYRSGAIENFQRAVRQTAAEYNSGRGGLGRAAPKALKAGLYTPFAIIDALQYPMFRLWIPALKIASYLKDVQTAIKLDPALAADKARRLLTFRKLAKSVDNRYGEMAYNTLFWNRTIKDIAVANTLSLGWNLGFIREYGGGAMDIGQAATRKGSIAQKARQGDLDRPLFVMFYTTQVMLYSGLLTWAMTGKAPTDFIDYLYPKSGDKDARGNDERLNTPFYPREFAAIAKHVEHEGLGPGMWHVVSNKSSGVVGLVKQWATGTNWMGQEIRDPNSAWHQQIRDTVAATLQDLEPISVGQLRQGEGTTKQIVTSFSGFGPAPKYVTQSSTEASVSQLYRKYYAPQQTPYESALISNDRRKLAKFYEEGKVEEYGTLLDEMMTKYDLTAAEQGRLARNIMKRGQDYNPYLTMFERLTWQQQKRLLDKMSEAERTEYLPHANREHLRYSYEESN